MLIDTMKLHVELMLQLQDKGAITFDYGNNIRARAKRRKRPIELGLQTCHF